MMDNPVAGIIHGIDTRLKRLEEQIGDVTDLVLQFLSIEEVVVAEDYVRIYKANINSSFVLGHGVIGITLIGDRRDMEVLVCEGAGI